MPTERYESILGYDNLTSRTFYKGKCKFYSLLVSGDGAIGTLDVYDSEGSTSDRVHKMHIEVKSGETVVWFSPKGTLLERGLHVVANATTTKYTVEYDPVPD